MWAARAARLVIGAAYDEATAMNINPLRTAAQDMLDAADVGPILTEHFQSFINRADSPAALANVMDAIRINDRNDPTVRARFGRG